MWNLKMWIVAAAVVLNVAEVRGDQLPSDTLTIRSLQDATALRNTLRTFVWGGNGAIPTTAATTTTSGSECTLTGLPNLARTEQLPITMVPNSEGLPQTSLACHFLANAHNGKLVVLHAGHNCYFNDGTSPRDDDNSYGMYRTIYSLLLDGYSVMGVHMPHYTPSHCPSQSPHEAMLNLHPTSGSSLRYFLDPTLYAINYANNLHRYSEINMVGLSGGGWTTVWYAALDPRIKTSVSVSGSLPFEFWPYNPGDEQDHPPYYASTGYRNLYALGGLGFQRRQIHVLNRHDDRCCFNETWKPSNSSTWETGLRGYEEEVRNLLVNLGGMFRVEIDEAPRKHTISRNAVTNVIRAELEGARLHVGGVDGTEAFVRGGNGRLWRFANSAWSDTGLTAVGVPAIIHVPGGSNTVNIFYRDASNKLRHAFPSNSGFTSVDLGGIIISDPAAVSSASGRWDVVAFGEGYELYHWSSAFSGFRLVSLTARGLGTPSLISTGANQLDIFFRGLGDGVFHMEFNGSSWSNDPSMQAGQIRGFPFAVMTSGPVRRVFAYGHDDRLYENSKSSGGAWSNWQSISNAASLGSVHLVGSPTASTNGGTTVHVATRTSTSNLVIFSRGRSGWSFTDLGSGVAGSPTAVQSSGAWIRGNSNGLWRNDGSGYASNGGWFE